MTLFEAAVNARNRGCDEIAIEIWEKSFASWTLKGGRYQNGWGVLEKGLCGLAVFAIDGIDEEISLLRAKVISRLSEKSSLGKDVCDQTAREIRSRAESLYRQGHWSSRIEMAVSKSDHAKLRPLLEEIAFTLSPSLAT
jgi:hypothetical protein